MTASVRAAGHTVARRRDPRVSLAAALVISGAIAMVAAALARTPLQWTPPAIPVAIFLIVALQRPFEPAPGEKFSLGAAVAFFAAAILPAAAAVAVVVGTSLLTRLVQRRSVLSAAVNASVMGAAAAAASLTLALLPGARALELAVAGGAYCAVTLAGVAVMVGASSGAAAARSFLRRELLPTAALVSIGAIGALLWERDGLAILLLGVPLALIEVGLRRVAGERAAHAALREAHAAQRQFTEDAAHELRTPLTALVGNLAFVRRDRLEPDEADALADAERTAASLKVLTERLLMLSRSGTPEDGSRTDLADVAREATSRAAPRPGVSVRFEGPAALEVAVSPELLAVIVNDLLANAVAYTERGSIVVRVAAADATASLVVADTGAGIPASELPRAFDRFFRGQRARTLAPGSGLGLAIVRRIAEAHGGSVTVTSAVGEARRSR